MKIYRPIKTNKLTQTFGENQACAKMLNQIQPVRPLQIVGAHYSGFCPIGYKSFYRLVGMKGHNGYDLGAWQGEPVYHSGDFEGVMKTEIDKDGGIGVRVTSKELVFTDSYAQLLYWHLKVVEGYDGKTVKPGDLIGYAGSTGSSSGPHVHLGLKFCDNCGKTLNTDNGYAGAVDLRPYWVDEFIGEIYFIAEPRLSIVDHVRKFIG